MEALLLLSTAVTLGLRHGLDWDHVAALIDISGGAGRERRNHALLLCLIYALGHAFIVAVLGIAALGFTAILPTWLDLVMQRIVGFTLLILSSYLFYAVFRAARTSSELKIESRWMFILSVCKRYLAKLLGRPVRQDSGELGGWSAFTIGVLHGLGAETGTQVLLIAAVGGANGHGLSLAMLMAFVVGLIVSNTVVAIVSTSGFSLSMRMRPLYLFAGGTACVFSLLVGLFLVSGHGESLPNLAAF